MDAVADVFQTMNIESVIQARLEASAPWGLKHEGNAEEGNGRHYVTRFAHFGMLTGGSCWLTADGLPDPIPLSDGDCFLFAAGSRYTVPGQSANGRPELLFSRIREWKPSNQVRRKRSPDHHPFRMVQILCNQLETA